MAIFVSDREQESEKEQKQNSYNCCCFIHWLYIYLAYNRSCRVALAKSHDAHEIENRIERTKNEKKTL